MKQIKSKFEVTTLSHLLQKIDSTRTFLITLNDATHTDSVTVKEVLEDNGAEYYYLVPTGSKGQYISAVDCVRYITTVQSTPDENGRGKILKATLL